MTYSERVIADGASNYWRLNETAGLTAVDAIGGKHGTISGGVTLNQPGVGGRPAMTFNGTTGKIVTAVAPGLLTPFTVELWVRRNSTTNNQVLFCTSWGAGDNFVLRVTSSGFDAYSVDAGAGGAGPTVAFTYDTQWHHLAWVCPGVGATRCYVDGALVPSGDATPIIFTSGVAKAFEIGFDPNWTYFNGTLQDIALYPHALTPAQILAHYRASFSPYQLKVMDDGASAYWPLDDASGTTARDVVGGKHGTISGGVTLNQSGVDGTTAMVFNGTTGVITLPSPIPIPGAITLEAWINLSTTPNTYGAILTRGDAGNTDYNFVLVHHGGGIVGVQCNYLGASGWFTDLSIAPYTTWDRWVHVVTTRDATGAVVSYYINGVLNSTFAGTGLATSPAASRQIGFDPGSPTSRFKGALQDIAIYPRALTPAEITAHYKSRVTLSQYQSRVLADGASAYWPLDEVAGTVARDLTAGAKHGTISGGVTLNQPGAGGGTAMTFDGTTGKIVTAANVALTFPLTFECWFKTTLTGETPFFGTLAAPWFGAALQGSIRPNHFVTYTDATTGYLTTLHGLTFNLAQWNHVAVIVANTGVITYINAVAGTPTTLAKTLLSAISQRVCIPEQGAIYGTWFAGSMQDVAIYPRVLSPAEIATHYQTRLVPPVTSTDLTTAFAGYLKTLRAANPGKDLTTLVMKDLPNVRAAAPDELDDINTMYDDYLGGD